MSGTSIIAKISMSLKGGYRSSSESTHVKMPNCWKSHIAAYIILYRVLITWVLIRLSRYKGWSVPLLFCMQKNQVSS